MANRLVSRLARQSVGALTVLSTGALLVGVGPGSVAQATSGTYVVAVTGTNGHLYATSPGSTTFQNLGGSLIGPPAVTYANGRYFFVVRGTDNALYVRTFTTGFTRLVSGSTYCIGPDVASDGSTLAVGCEGSNGALYAAEVAAPKSGNPVIASLSNEGGKLDAGPGLSFFNSKAAAEAVGAAYDFHGGTYDTYTRPLVSGGWTADASSYCGASMIVSSYISYGWEYQGCEYATSHALYFVRADYKGGCAGGGGAIEGRIGIAVTGKGSAALFFVEGTNGALYLTTSVCGSSKFTKIAGAAEGGVAATGGADGVE